MTKMLPLCALLLLPATAFAAPEPAPSEGINDEGAQVTQEGETRRLIFGVGDEVDGESLAPTGVDLNGRIRKQHDSMIKVRENFLDQLFKLSADF